ncbi:protein MutL [Thermacetogenium phaeum DSM 12270]|uniref:Protein MutL n=1 Tax=Thermacetogenium phaeum (strain ATCC BAA-254 / DSM 26808 / PB) TaxID=1089553 RepID=K4LGT7_THEPS|nr:methylaspartate mutase accessory protein GlmL [Thermacetogenium phaeum]AFV12221.1 protein MutL [Thermacetogenium phaeum DSM 12270]
MKALLIDFGSTFTKVTLVSLDPPALLGTAQAPTTVETDLREGLFAALKAFPSGLLEGVRLKRACSSAAGGLRIVAVGLVPALTVKAAREAALGAGARVVASFSYTLTRREIEEINALRPDLLLLAGGTDGGERRTLLKNASLIARSGPGVPVVVAGNKEAAPRAASLLEGSVPRVVVTENVLPEINVLNPEPARKAIRELYLDEITKARGLEQIQQEFGLAMPTPLAVMKAGELLQKTLGKDVVLVDVGGATTDVHSFCEGKPLTPGCVYKGPPEPFAKRTVEGDLGVRVSVLSLLEAVGEDAVLSLLPFAVSREELRSYAARINAGRGAIPQDERTAEFDRALATACIREALRRHAGRLREAYTPEGRIWIQEGKDLTGVEVLAGTGGVLVHAADPAALLQEAVRQSDPLVLSPRRPDLFLDGSYLLAAVGLLVDVCPEAAQVLLRETLEHAGRCAF